MFARLSVVQQKISRWLKPLNILKTTVMATLTGASAAKAQVGLSISAAGVAEYFGIDPILVLTGCLGGFTTLGQTQERKTFMSAFLSVITALAVATTLGPWISHGLHIYVSTVPLTFVKLAVGFFLGISAPKIIVALPNLVPDMANLFRKVLATWLKVPDTPTEEIKPSNNSPKV